MKDIKDIHEQIDKCEEQIRSTSDPNFCLKVSGEVSALRWVLKENKDRL